jgi:hypothetical protein
MSSFLESVESLLKQKGLEQSTVNNYVKTIIKLNDNVAPSSGDFLKKTANILDQLNETKNPNTYASKLSAVVSVTKVLAEKYKGFIKPAKAYEAHLKEVVDEKRSSEKDNEGKKTEKQEENWVDWSEVEKLKDDLSKQATEYSLKKHLTAKQFNTVLNNLVLSLYSEVAPRRNKDYQEMVVVNKWNEKMPNDMNYLSLDDKKFVFNTYKTVKKTGRQIESFADKPKLIESLEMYLKVHPLKSKKPMRLLTKPDGTPLSSVNSITRILNTIFKPTRKLVSSSMLRHVYLSNKYGDVVSEMNRDADAMGHSRRVAQESYIKTD